MSLLKQLEQEIADRLAAGAEFAEVEILVDPQKNIAATVQQDLAKLKTLVAPLVTTAVDDSPNVPAPYFNGIEIAVSIYQNPLLAGTEAGVWDLAEAALARLKGWMPDSLVNVLTPRRPTIERVTDPTLNIVTVNLETKGGFIAALEQVAAVMLERNADIVTLTCATDLAPIYYTLDGRNPNPFSGTLYTAPFAITPPVTVRARAGRWGWLASKITTQRLD